MKIWDLLPINRENPNWEASAHRDRVVIRADKAERARQIARGAFAKAPLHVPGTDAIHSPWNHHDMVTCRELSGGDFAADGEEAILDPAEYDRETARLEGAES